jgi:putative flavoprotein involved in K+ transport
MNHVDVLVIGASQAGLAMGYFLKQTDLSFVLVDKGSAVGEVWKKRYDSLVLFTPRAYSSLPGLSLDGDSDGYPTKDGIADYLERYATYFEIPIHLNTEVFHLEKTDFVYRAVTNKGEYTSNQVVIATGPFQKPFIPPFSQYLSNDVFQVHTSSYFNPSQLKEGSVLVVGGGNSGAQIAVELSQDREVYLSIGHKLKFFPFRILNKSIFWWFDQLGILKAHVNTKFGRFIKKQNDPVFGKELKFLIQQGKVKLKPRTQSIHSDVIHFEDHTQVKVENIVWAIGFYSDYSWIKIPEALDDDGEPVHIRGTSLISGLFFLGLPWQYRRGSALIGGVGEDAKFLSNQIVEFAESSPSGVSGRR